MTPSDTLRIACAQLVSTGAMDELDQLVEKEAFDRWKGGGPDNDAMWEHPTVYKGQVELLQMIRNIGNSGMT